jgi:hypothetical protein
MGADEHGSKNFTNLRELGLRPVLGEAEVSVSINFRA